MTYDDVLQPQAERDIRTEAHWILEQAGSSVPPLRLVRRLRSKIATLKHHPQRCPIDPDSDVYGEEVRVLLHGKRPGIYRVLFAIRRDRVYVLTVRHSAKPSLAEEMVDE